MHEVRARGKELETLKRAIIDAESELKVVKQLTKAFGEVKDAGVKAIASVAADAERGIVHAGGVCEKHMTASAGKLDAHIQRTMEGVRAGLGEWGELQEQKARLKDALFPGLVLLGILRSPEYLSQVPIPLMLQLLESLQLWAGWNLKDVSVQPSQRIWKKEPNLNPYQSYKIPFLIDFVCEALREIVIQRSRKE